jgi:hypothetical protein
MYQRHRGDQSRRCDNAVESPTGQALLAGLGQPMRSPTRSRRMRQVRHNFRSNHANCGASTVACRLAEERRATTAYPRIRSKTVIDETCTGYSDRYSRNHSPSIESSDLASRLSALVSKRKGPEVGASINACEADRARSRPAGAVLLQRNLRKLSCRH